jgi:LAO/AO transport system kinase
VDNKQRHINPKLKEKIKSQEHNLEVEEIYNGILRQDRYMLSKAITMVESTREEDREKSIRLQEKINSNKQFTPRIVITGAPGVGKSTFINTLGRLIIERGQSVAILATDPSSAISKGSILGDKTRMAELSMEDKAFIRPSPSGNHLGGVTSTTLETISICELAGFDYILLETVGVGQSEYLSYNMSDLFLLLISPGGGDELQGIKRGIVEMADIICINKADGDQKQQALLTAKQYKNGTHFLTNQRINWSTKIMEISALENTGMENLLLTIENYISARSTSGLLQEERKRQNIKLLDQKTKQYILDRATQNPEIKNHNLQLHNKIEEGQTSLAKAIYEMKENVDKNI